MKNRWSETLCIHFMIFGRKVSDHFEITTHNNEIPVDSISFFSLATFEIEVGLVHGNYLKNTRTKKEHV